MTPEQMIAKLESLDEFQSVAHVTTFRCSQKSQRGEVQEVTVEIHDAGPNAIAGLRYSCIAHTKDGKRATGNPNSSLDVVLATVHWGDLD